MPSNPSDMKILAADAGVALTPPEKLEVPVDESVEFLEEMIRQERRAKNPETATVGYRIRIVDADFVEAGPSDDIEANTDARALAAYIPAAQAIMATADQAIATARTSWGDPQVIAAKVAELQRAAVEELVAHYRECRVAARRFADARQAPPFAPDDILALELAGQVVKNWLPDACLAWFTDRAVEGGPQWWLLRQVVARLASKPPAHLNIPEFVRALEALADRPAYDPSTRARLAREYAQGIVQQLRGAIERWALAAAAARM